uniref:Uncharacterized protein ycf22 n=1 Tax=Antithamnion sp. TaxID=2767 RepID=YCF22_ANTSP|nr:RecName: Full=Uncharacterized protein ycf22 [Antithamnion sp.]CAA83939.1 unknown [Antithamnion sp.]
MHICIINSIIWFIVKYKKKHGYSLFVEFTHAYGIGEGTSVNMRGVNIGYIKNLQINSNSVLVSIYIKSEKILIPKNSIIETNQTSLFNNTIIDIIPLEKINNYSIRDFNVFNQNCYDLQIFCNNQYIIGDRGLNYDDLIRATTRIAQRFDDPRFFNLFYLFLQNTIEISDDFILTFNNISSMSYYLYIFCRDFLLNNI